MRESLLFLDVTTLDSAMIETESKLPVTIDGVTFAPITYTIILQCAEVVRAKAKSFVLDSGQEEAYTTVVAKWWKILEYLKSRRFELWMQLSDDLDANKGGCHALP